MNTSTPKDAEKTVKQPPSPPFQPMVLDGHKLPCYVKAAVYQSGQAAALAIKTTDSNLMADLLQDEVEAPLIRDMIRNKAAEDISLAGITTGIKEEEILGTLDDFVEKIVEGTGDMATRIIAEGQPSEPGEDGWLEYLLNSNGKPIRELGRADQAIAFRKVHQVKEGDVLVVRHPPTPGKDGSDVRGENVKPAREPREVSIQTACGPNTTVEEEKLLAAITGAYREDEQGRIRVVQEVKSEEVNAATGDLPKTGVASTKFWILKGVRRGSGVFTTEDVLVGSQREAGALDEQTRIRAGNLVVNGQVAGGQLPPEYLSGEIEGLEEADQKKLERQLEKSHVEVEELFAAREVLGRNISAGTILVQAEITSSALDAEKDILVDGNLVGGVASFGCRCQVLGNLGNVKGSPTRIRIGGEDRTEKKKDRFQSDIQNRKSKLETLNQALDTHQEEMERWGRKSEFWAAFLQGEKRVPKNQTERRLLVQFFEASKKKAQMERDVLDCKREMTDLAQLAQEMDEGTDEAQTTTCIAVGGTVYPGVTLEWVRPLEEEDLEREVLRKFPDNKSCLLQDIKRELSNAIRDYLEPRQDQMEERQEALDHMFEGMEKRPSGPTIPNKRFQIELLFPDTLTEETAQEEGQKLPSEAMLYAYSRTPQTFYLKQTWMIIDPLKNVTISVAQSEEGCTVRFVPNPEPIIPWQEHQKVLEQLDAVQVLGQTPRKLLRT